MPHLNNKDADLPAHLRSLISTFLIRSLDSIISIDAISEISRLLLASVAEQAGSSLPGLESPRFSSAMAIF